MLKKNSKFNDLHIITNWLKKKGWYLFQHQIDLLEKSKKGFDVVLNSPTGTGKTLAGFLPSIEDLVQNNSKKLHTLYISPLKSLTYDIERNLKKPINEMNLDISFGTRTGDTQFSMEFE